MNIFDLLNPESPSLSKPLIVEPRRLQNQFLRQPVSRILEFGEQGHIQKRSQWLPSIRHIAAPTLLAELPWSASQVGKTQIECMDEQYAGVGAT
jgi:hypothetical protein